MKKEGLKECFSCKLRKTCKYKDILADGLSKMDLNPMIHIYIDCEFYEKANSRHKPSL